VLDGFGQGLGEIASLLELSDKTVSTYRARVLQKMGMRTNAEIIRYAILNELSEFTGKDSVPPPRRRPNARPVPVACLLEPSAQIPLPQTTQRNSSITGAQAASEAGLRLRVVSGLIPTLGSC
jgi:hypothetical protein